MNIPRIAIQRPVMMFMLSAVVVLLGAVSLTRLPVDLMPELAQPTITVSVNYSGVGPLEMEQLVTRPLEQAVSAVAGLRQVNSTPQRRGADEKSPAVRPGSTTISGLCAGRNRVLAWLGQAPPAQVPAGR